MNPTFAPKAPLAESTRDRIFETFKEELVNAKGGGQNVALRQTAQLHNVSMDRAKAVIRLKVHEEDLKGKVSQRNDKTPQHLTHIRMTGCTDANGIPEGHGVHSRLQSLRHETKQ